MTLGGHTARIHACAFAPDGSLLASASGDWTLRLWDTATGVEIGILGQHLAEVQSCAFAPDGSFVVSVSGDKTVKLLDPSITGDWHRAELRTIQGHTGGLSDCAVAPDGSIVVSASSQGPPLKLWDPFTGKELRTLVAANRLHRAAACAVAPDGSCVASAGRDYALYLWDLHTGKQIEVLLGHRGPVLACAFAPDGAFLVSASADGTLKLWDHSTGEVLLTLDGHAGEVRGCAVTPDGSFVLSSSEDRTLKIWNQSTGKPQLTLPLGGGLTCTAVHPSLPIAASGDQGGNLYFVDLVGIEYGPIIVTAVGRGGRRTVRCPKCWQVHPLDETWLGQVIDCPTPTCDLRLRVNPFFAGGRQGNLLRRFLGRS